jgi:hypothetical protein
MEGQNYPLLLNPLLQLRGHNLAADALSVLSGHYPGVFSSKRWDMALLYRFADLQSHAVMTERKWQTLGQSFEQRHGLEGES